MADDEESIRWVLVTTLAEEGHSVDVVDSGQAALERLSDAHYDLAFIDIRMGDLDGLAVLDRVREGGLETPIVIITAQNTMANAIEAMKRGAYDYLTKPFDVDEVRLLAQRVLEMHQQSADLARLKRDTRKRFELGVELIGKTVAMQEIFKTIGRVSQTDATVLIRGESGSGKELIARAIHAHSPRWSGSFIALNCAAVPRDLLESELFGYERGAFTGATEQRAGVFEVASGGTLFLDEIGDMPIELQVKLLRVLQEKELSRVGSREVIQVDLRLIAATNQDLEAAIRERRFREDLFFRLNVVPISVPPLRMRRDDIPDLVSYFLEKINRDMGTRITGISPEALSMLHQYPWPGNVRELENTLVRAAVLAPGPTLMPHDFVLVRRERPDARDGGTSFEDVLRTKLRDYFRRARESVPSGLYEMIIESVERPLIELALEETGGNQVRAAVILGINRNTLRKKITQLKIDPRRYVEDAV